MRTGRLQERTFLGRALHYIREGEAVLVNDENQAEILQQEAKLKGIELDYEPSGMFYKAWEVEAEDK